MTVGFCFGGAQSFMQGARDHGLAGVVGFYGSLVREGQRWTLDRAPEITVPVLGLFAGDDKNITPDLVAEFGARLTRPARDPHLSERAALVLRPPPGAVRGRVRGRVEPRPGVHISASS